MITDAMVEAAIAACTPLVSRATMRAALEAATRTAPAPEPLPRAMTKEEWARLNRPRTAPPAPTAAPREYEGLCERLFVMSDPLSHDAYAAIRKLTAERDEARALAAQENEFANLNVKAKHAAEARAAVLEAAAQAAPATDKMREALTIIADGFYLAKEAPDKLDEFVQLARDTLAAAQAAPAPDLAQQYARWNDEALAKIRELEMALRQIADRTGAEVDEPWSQARAEAALEAAPAPDALPRWYNLVCARCGEDIRRREEAAPAPKTKRKPPTRHSRRLP